MSGIKETRKKIQRSIIQLVQVEKLETVLHELSLLKQTVDSQLDIVSKS